jgi:signal transduction histidine kinase
MDSRSTKSTALRRDRLARARRSRPFRVATSPIALFAVSGLIAATILGAVGVLFTHHQAVQESLRNARSLTRVLAATLRPSLNDALLRSDPAAVAGLDAEVRRRVLADPVIRIKVWSPSGKIVYSDEPRLVGAVYPLKPDDRAAMISGQIDAEVSDVSRPENRFERGYGRILEVYMPVHTSTHHNLLFETYLRYDAVAANVAQLFGAFTPAVLVGLALLWLVQLPLAWSLARRLRRHQERQEQLLLRALDASDEERRRIASDLHDTVVQDLAGISFSLAAVGRSTGSATTDETQGAIRSAAAGLRENMRHLRTLLVEIYPPSARSAGLHSALEHIVGESNGDGPVAELHVDAELKLAADREELIYRAAQEALRNARKHSGATKVDVTLGRENGDAVLTVADDGVGFDAGTVERRREEKHFGLELLADRARRLGGDLQTISSPGEGTTVRLEVPLE